MNRRTIKLLPVVFTAAAIAVSADQMNVATWGKDAHPVSAPQIEYVDSLNAPERCAAISYIMGRLVSGQHIEEDWTWQDAPQEVTHENDRILNDLEASGAQDAEMWLAQENTKCMTLTPALHT